MGISTSVMQVSEASNRVTLSEMSDEELLNVMKLYNVIIPDELNQTIEESLDMVRVWCRRLENDEKSVFGYSDVVLHDFSSSVKRMVSNYYGLSNLSAPRLIRTNTNGLKENVLVSTPSNKGKYNCYAYAIGKTDGFYAPGGFSYGSIAGDVGSYSIYQIAIKTKEDLQIGLSMPCVKLTTVRPYYTQLKSGQSAICVRKGKDGSGGYDFHYMRLCSGDVWRHKPGGYAILQYKYYPDNSKNWTFESYDGSNYFTTDMVYSGTIYYLLYKNVHSLTYKATGDHYHSGSYHYYEYAYVCSDCGAESGNTWKKRACSGPPCRTTMRQGGKYE